MDLEDSYFDCLIRRHVLCRKEMSKGCISASVRYINQAHIVSREHASAILRQLPARLPPTMFLHQWRGEVKHVNTTLQVAHAKTLLHVRCGLHSLVACRLATWRDVRLQSSIFWAHCIIARLHFRHRGRMLETLVADENDRVSNTRVLRTCPYCGGNGNEDGYRPPYGGMYHGQRTCNDCKSCGGSGRLNPFGLRSFHNTFV